VSQQLLKVIVAMRQVNKRGKKIYGKEKNSNSFAHTLGLKSRPSAFALIVVPARHHAGDIQVILSAICDCVNTNTIVYGQGYSNSPAVSTLKNSLIIHEENTKEMNV
jgi:hypothetical protein